MEEEHRFPLPGFYVVHPDSVHIGVVVLEVGG
jgi:hypothetical protein